MLTEIRRPGTADIVGVGVRSEVSRGRNEGAWGERRRAYRQAVLARPAARER